MSSRTLTALTSILVLTSLSALAIPIKRPIPISDDPIDRNVAIQRAVELTRAMLRTAQLKGGAIPRIQNTREAYKISSPSIHDPAVVQPLNPRGGGLQFNLSMSGVNLKKLANPATAVLYYDSRPWPDGKLIVSYANGNAKVVNAKAFAKSSITPVLKG